MVHVVRVDPMRGVGDEPTHPPVQRTPDEQAAYERVRAEHTKAHAADDEHECAKQARAANLRPTATLRATWAHGRAKAINSRILRDENGTPYFPRASQNVVATATIMRTIPPQASPEGQCIMDELRVLQEVAVCQHADSSEDKRDPGTSSNQSPNG
ncbi:hypothetical protein C2845_PM08G14630 [Panicum miliaceum]|uniref:Uncharacterized protein n=1 Tax=Panicum miliaceum TaxID=4540 RepID=A0A3L6R239_PANMI|nr:hypothetical protein C2845_PM08G14630 [Panicum miliaceum]